MASDSGRAGPMPWTLTFLGLILFVLLAARLSQAQERGRVVPGFDEGPPRVGEKAPDFTATDETGKEIKLSDLRGSYVALQFGAYT